MTGNIAGRQLNPTRDRYDFYPTDPAWVRVLLDVVDFEGDISEPCAGDGAISNELKRLGHRVIASDINPRAVGIGIGDAFRLKSATNVITNAPFRGAFEMLQHWLDVTSCKVAILTQASFLESKIRGEFYIKRPPNTVIMVCKRMKVFGKISQFPHTWLVWDNANRPKKTQLVWKTDL